MKQFYLAFCLLLLVVSSCEKITLLEDENITENGEYNTSTEDDLEEVPDWTDATHSKSAEPNFDIVFDQSKVLRMDITISSEAWSTMENDLSANIGGSAGGFPGGGPGRAPGDGGVSSTSDYDPIWVPCDILFEGKNWYRVGIRYKGNSSLTSAYQAGIDKLSLKLDFDQFEDDYPLIKNQRFYGFKQLNLNNNFDDLSFLREKVASDLFREFGMAAANTSFCEVYIDYGSGSKYFGLYTIVEEVDDTVIETQFVDGSGNLYKPDGSAATFANNSFNTSELCLKTNEDICDYSDARMLYDILNSSTRTSDEEGWKLELENIFDVNTFLKYLAVSTTIQHWDSYGNMSHNYYIYNNPATNLLTWIPWDHNESLQEGKGNNPAMDPDDLSRVGSDWPLISYLIAVEVYHQKYKQYLSEFINEVFVPEVMISKYENYYTLLKQYAYAEEKPMSFLSSGSQFDSAINSLKSHVQTRNNVVKSYIE